MKKRLFTTIAALCLAASLGGCGSSDSSAADIKVADTQSSVRESSDDTQSSVPGSSDDSFELFTGIVDRFDRCDTLDQLIENSQAVIIGEIVGEPETEAKYEENNPNNIDWITASAKVKVEKILAGSCPDEITVKQNSGFADKNGKRILYAFSDLSPMKQGDKWIFFLSYQKDYDCYWPTGDGQGRCPLPEDLDKPDSYGFVNGLIKDSGFLKSVYDQIKEKFGL